MPTKSLRRELLGWLVIPLAAVVSFNVWTTYENALETADLITDRTLLSSARAIAESIRETDGVLEAPIPPAALEMFASDPPDRVIYRVASPSGQLLAGYPDILIPPKTSTGLDPLYFDSRFRNEPIRAVVLAQPIIGKENAGTATVAVGQTIRNHHQLVTGLWLKSLRDQVLLVAAAGLLALWGLRRGLAPVLRLRDEVRRRDPSLLHPFQTGDVHSELRPLVSALNDAFARVQRQVEAQRRFVANAAHQLRQPLALIKTQASVGRRANEVEAKDEALSGIDAAVNRMSYLSNQLLALARAEQGSSLLRKDIIDFGRVAREAVENLAEFALKRGIDLGLELEGDAFSIKGHASLLGELVSNLTDNALRYTPAGGFATVRIKREDDCILLNIEDNGPGIPETDRERVFERFYRCLDSGSDGTGLGLAIVREIVHAHDGTIDLGRPAAQPQGLLVLVRLPVDLG